MKHLAYPVLPRRIIVTFFVAFAWATGIAMGDETVTTPAPACGNTPAVTTSAYSSQVEITASGNVFFVPPDSYYDPFYGYTSSGPSSPTGGSPLRMARLSNGTACTCSLDCPGQNFPASDLLLGEYPEYNPLHTYTVVLDLGPLPDRIAFGFPDCGCWDN
jgi:hypothetical protein